MTFTLWCNSNLIPLASTVGLEPTYQRRSNRRKLTQDFSSTFLLRGLPYFFSRKGFSRPFPSSTVKSNFVYTRTNRSPLMTCWASFIYFEITEPTREITIIWIGECFRTDYREVNYQSTFTLWCISTLTILRLGSNPGVVACLPHRFPGQNNGWR